MAKFNLKAISGMLHIAQGTRLRRRTVLYTIESAKGLKDSEAWQLCRFSAGQPNTLTHNSHLEPSLNVRFN